MTTGNSNGMDTLKHSPVASFTKQVNPWLAKRPLKTNGRLANQGLTSLVKEATGVRYTWIVSKVSFRGVIFSQMKTTHSILRHTVVRSCHLFSSRKFTADWPLNLPFNIIFFALSIITNSQPILLSRQETLIRVRVHRLHEGHQRS